MLQEACSVLTNNVRGQVEHLSVLKNVDEQVEDSFFPYIPSSPTDLFLTGSRLIGCFGNRR